MPDFCNFFITFLPLLSCYSSKASNSPTAENWENCLLPFELTSTLLNDQQCSVEIKMKLMLQFLFENQKYGMLLYKIILKYGSCKHQENIHLVRKQILFTYPVNAFVHKLFKIMEILFAFGLVIIFTE